MASKTEYLKRYMSTSAKSSKMKKKKKSKRGNVSIHDEDHTWDPKNLDKVRRRWDRDTVDDDAPVIVQDLPTCANPELLQEYLQAKQQQQTDIDTSPPRRRSRREEDKNDDGDASPPRRHDRTENKTASGHRAGLQTGEEFGKRERLLRASEHEMMSRAAKDEASEKTVYRDRKGRKLDMLNEMMRQREIQQGKRAREAMEEYEWGTGSVQKRDRIEARDEMKKMQQAPFSRYQNDPQLEQMRRDRIRADDPMQSQTYARISGQGGEAPPTDRRSSSDYPKYKGPPAPTNRFGIPPGYRWDGVVRGRNWEEKVLRLKNESKASREDAYKWSVADM